MFDRWLFSLLGVIMAVFGYLIRFGKRYHLIAGYDERYVRDPERLAKIVGRTMFAGAAWLFLLAAIAPMFSAQRGIIHAAMFVGLGLLALIAATAGKGLVNE